MKRELTGNWIPFEKHKIVFKSKTSKSICSELNKNFLILILKAINNTNTSTTLETFYIQSIYVHCEMKFYFCFQLFSKSFSRSRLYRIFIMAFYLFFSKLKEKFSRNKK